MRRSKSINLNTEEIREMEKKGLYHIRAFLHGQNMPDVMLRAADFIQNLDDVLGVRFRLACDFMAYDLEDAFSANIDAVSCCGFFPCVELGYEFDALLTLLLQGAFKSSRDSMRRMLDVCLTSVVYLTHMKCREEARYWISSKAETPQFSRNIKCLQKRQDVVQLDKKFKFTDGLKSLYWHLSDYCHSKGIEFSTGIRKGNELDYNGVVIRGFNEDECRKAMKDFVSVVEQLVILLVIQNMGLLVPVDKDAKWGLNPPVSGFFYEHQTERLLNLMPSGYAEYFKQIAADDPSLISLRKFFTAMPDITEEEMHLQSAEIERDIRALGSYRDVSVESKRQRNKG